jgi:hypothetical protein
MINKKFPIVSLVFYILAGLFLIFAVWAAVFSFRYISTMVSMGQIIVSDNLFEITSFHMANFGQYIVYAALLFGAGWIVQLISAPKAETLAAVEADVEEMEALLEDLEAEDEEEE